MEKERKVEAYPDKKIDVKTVTYSKSNHDVKAIASLSVRFDMEDMMDIIIENWESFDGPVRRMFARRIAALDKQDAFKELARDFNESVDDEGFNW